MLVIIVHFIAAIIMGFHFNHSGNDYSAILNMIIVFVINASNMITIQKSVTT